VDTPLLSSKAFHFFGTSQEISKQIPELLQLRKVNGIGERPFIVWEPLPVACTTTNRQSILEACKLVDVFSPNHIEYAALFQGSPSEGFDADTLESYGQTLLDSSVGPNGEGIVIIRAAEHGSLSMSRTSRPTWLPSYYEKGASGVVDPTGAGNTFLGGFIAGWQRTNDVHESICYGHVVASFALEQIGLPKLEEKEGIVVCNAVRVVERLEVYRQRLSEATVKSEGML
jgi:sugar/nucleoside kinase (ribokinase family)